LRVVPGYPGVTEVVVSDGESRTVFGRYCDLLFTTRQWDDPDLSKIAAARIVSVDSSFGETAVAAARQAVAQGVPVVTYDARHDGDLAASAAALIISGEFIRREFPAATASAEERAHLFDRYLERCPGLVVFTAGSRPVWWGRGRVKAPGEEPDAGGRAAHSGRRHELEAFQVKVVDSAGAGDSFRGGLVYGMLQGWPDVDCVRFAAAVAALVCTRAPGCVHPPALAEVRALLSGTR
jgi:sugar/nucleoside kinase (ribokinase family)